MSLSERLERARIQQLMEAGVLPRREMLVAPAEPDVDVVDEGPMLEDHSQGLFAPITIEARPVGLVLVAEPAVDLIDTPESADADSAEQADNTVCPTCNAIGAVDMIDLVGHTVHYTCGACSTMWQVRKPVVTESLP